MTSVTLASRSFSLPLILHSSWAAFSSLISLATSRVFLATYSMDSKLEASYIWTIEAMRILCLYYLRMPPSWSTSKLSISFSKPFSSTLSFANSGLKTLLSAVIEALLKSSHLSTWASIFYVILSSFLRNCSLWSISSWRMSWCWLPTLGP